MNITVYYVYTLQEKTMCSRLHYVIFRRLKNIFFLFWTGPFEDNLVNTLENYKISAFIDLLKLCIKVES